MTQLQVNQFSHGILNPGLGCLMSCLGSFLGLRCLTRARACLGRNRAIWLLIASVAIGGTGIWVTHVVAMLGYTIPGQQILYNVPMTVISLGVAIAVVAAGLFIAALARGGLGPVLAGGVIMGTGIAAMHYFGMAAVSMHGTVQYNLHLVGISVLIAIVTCAAALAAGLRVRGVWSSLGVSIVMGVAISGMHYTGMAAMRVYAGRQRAGHARGTLEQPAAPAPARGERGHVPAHADRRHVTQRGRDPRRRQPDPAPAGGSIAGGTRRHQRTAL